MRKLLIAAVVLATPLLGWQAANAAAAPVASAPVATEAAPAVQPVVWAWVNGHHVWLRWHPGHYRGWVRGHFVRGHWRYGRWIPRHWIPAHRA